MTSNEIFLLIILVIGWLTAVVIAFQCSRWRIKHNKAVDIWSTECDRKNKLIESLENELKAYKDMERVIKIERVTIQPRELECKFTMHEIFIEDQKTFKKIITSETARYIAEELEKDSCLYKLYFEKSIYNFNENIIVKLRLLPYPEEANWNLKEEE